MPPVSLGVLNRFRRQEPRPDRALRRAVEACDPLAFHRTLPGYCPTPLVSLPGQARRLGLREVLVKDEAHRLGLNAFKVLGASYAVYRFLRRQWEDRQSAPFGDTLALTPEQRRFFEGATLCTATDGNHGRAVAWSARVVGLPAVIYLPAGSATARVENIRREGARAEVIDGGYDDAVRQIRNDAAARGWQIISDTAWPGYTEIPAWIQAAYTTLFRELEQTLARPGEPGVDAVIVQGGVGALAAGAAWHYAEQYGARRPRLICVEPVGAACLLASARSPKGTPVPAGNPAPTIMAGLNCREVSVAAWPLIRDTFDAFVAIEDDYAVEAMNRYYRPEPGDPRIIAGESGAAGLAALLALCADPALADLRSALGLGPASRVLLLNTEGATDPVGFARAVGAQP